VTASLSTPSKEVIVAKALEWKFDPNQDYQLAAIQSVIDALEGTPPYRSEFALGEDVVPNLPEWEYLDEQALAENVARVQRENQVQLRRDNAQRDLFSTSPTLEVDEGMVLAGAGYESWRYPSFTIEMETGTGKTYVYLRTIYELRKHYGFRKFIVVVPSIAIYEGVVKSFDIMKSHFAALYGNETVNLLRYDSGRMSDLRTFATSSFVEILVMTLASFNRASGRYPNRIYRASEQLPGERLPYQYIQDVRPILILDEPQNMSTETAKQALRTLHPLFALRYSATHTEAPNLLYQLTPFDAYQRSLVKRIEVTGVTEEDNFNRPLLVLEGVERKSSQLLATVRTYVSHRGALKEDTVVLRQDDNLYDKTGNERHRDGFRVEEIYKAHNETGVRFTGGDTITETSVFAGNREIVFQFQIDEAVQKHMARQEALLPRGIKVLSLFFIDRVANYVEEDGLIRRLFEEAFNKHRQYYPHFQQFKAEQVHSGYFAKQKKKGSGEEEAIDTSGSNKTEREAEREAFQLIMREKERLLSLDEPVSFIFAHSALKEGWDNPNVFGICTLNQTVSERKKRQEIGRGLRICVNQEGERVFDEDVNVLLVVANESYEHYVSTLQSEYEEEGHFHTPPPPTKAGRAKARRNDSLYHLPAFQDFWAKLARRTDYRIHVDTAQLVQSCTDKINNTSDSEIQPRIVIQRGRYVVTRYTLSLLEIKGNKARLKIEKESTHDPDPDLTVASYGARADLAKHDPRLQDFKIEEIVHDPEPHVRFTNDIKLYVDEPYSFESEHGHEPVERATLAPETTYPVPNLLERTARETGLTRPTINRIFRGLSDRKKRALLTNPEGFIGFFIGEINKALGDHIAEHIEFTLAADEAPYDLESLFPREKEFPQARLVEAGQQGLYDQVQTDSDVEQNFVEQRLREDEDVVAYFKFPAKFKINFPKYLGNYNPDWGIIRRAGDGEVTLHLVRETKGSEEIEKLQFSHERFKIKAARKHFREIGIDYRVVTDDVLDWAIPADELPDQQALYLET
jgi:type III restriction enzyme